LLMAGVIAANLLVFTVLPLIGGPQIGEPPAPVDIAVFAGLLLSLGVFFLAYYEVLPSERMLDFGLLYEVALAVLVGVLLKLVTEPVRVPQSGMSGICLIILLFPVIVPNTLGKVLVTSFVVASMDPLGVYLAGLVGRTVPPPRELFEAYYWNYVCVALALIPAYTLRGLSRQVGEARAMGSYRLVRLLGEGGMGEVWTAEHRLLARPAAIKLIKPDVLEASRKRGGPGPLERFRREAEATAALRSPHSIELYDFGVTDDGTFYLVMELLDGFDLDSMVARFGPVPAERAIHFLLQACDSLAEAHANELIHRDIKPANIYSCRLGLNVDRRGHRGGHPGFHRARDGRGGSQRGREGRHLLAGMRGLLAADGQVGVHGQSDAGDDGPHPQASGAAIRAYRARRTARPGAGDHALPREGPSRPPAHGGGSRRRPRCV